MSERFTFAMIKSHVAEHRVLTEIVLTRIVRSGLAIRELSWRTLDRQMIAQLYEDHVRRDYYPTLAASVSGRVIPMVLSASDDAVLRWRSLLGETNPAKAAPHTLRANFGDHHKMADNVGHGADSERAARREIKLFYPDFDLDAVWVSAGAVVSSVRGDHSAETLGNGHIRSLEEGSFGGTMEGHRLPVP